MQFVFLVGCLFLGYVHSGPIAEPKPKPVEAVVPDITVPDITVPDITVPLHPKSAAGEPEQDASSAVIRIPVDNANKLLYDLDATVKQLFDDKAIAKEEKSEDEADAPVYSAANRELDFYPRQTENTHQGASLVTQLEGLEKRLLNTITELQTRRRYFSSTMLRQMYNSVHRIRLNISRIQTQFSSPQQPVAAAPSPARPGQGPGMMNNLQQRVSDIQKAVNDIINRVTSTFQGPNAQKPAGQHPPQTNFN